MTGEQKTAAPAPWRRVAPAVFAVAWGGNEFTPLLGLYRAEGGLSGVAVNILLGSYVLGIIPAMLVGGPLSDRYGRRPLMLLAPVVASCGSFMLAVGSRSFTEMIAGRVLSGIALGLVMTVGSAWLKELSEAPYEARPEKVSGARRASLSLTAGFGLGAAVAAVLAQFFPYPTVLAYSVNIAITLPTLIPLLRAPETSRGGNGGSLLDDLRIPAAKKRRFWLVVAPASPWIFGCAAAAYAVLPALMEERIGHYTIGFSGLMCMIALGCGFAVQPFSRVLDKRGGVTALTAALAVVAAGLTLGALAIWTLNLALIMLAAALLGCGYGLVLVGGLTEIQRIATPDDLAGLTGVYYSIAYLGFFTPMVLSLLELHLSYPTMFLGGAVLSLGCLALIHAARGVDCPEGAA
ncbi:MFS transporter [Dermabacteraceae bacterium P13095]